MSKFDPTLSLPNSTSAFHEQLNSLSSSTRPLFVNKQGVLANARPLEFAWEKFKEALGLISGANTHLIESKTLQFLNQGKLWIQPEEDLQKVMLLAERAGLMTPGNQSHSELETLIAELSTPPATTEDLTLSPMESAEIPFFEFDEPDDGVVFKKIPQERRTGLLLKAGVIAGSVLAAATTGFVFWNRRPSNPVNLSTKEEKQSEKQSLSEENKQETKKETKEETNTHKKQEEETKTYKPQEEGTNNQTIKAKEENSLESVIIENRIEQKFYKRGYINNSTNDFCPRLNNTERLKNLGGGSDQMISTSSVQNTKTYLITVVALTIIVGLAAYFLKSKKPSSNKNSKDSSNPDEKDNRGSGGGSSSIESGNNNITTINQVNIENSGPTTPNPNNKPEGDSNLNGSDELPEDDQKNTNNKILPSNNQHETGSEKDSFLNSSLNKDSSDDSSAVSVGKDVNHLNSMIKENFNYETSTLKYTDNQKDNASAGTFDDFSTSENNDIKPKRLDYTSINLETPKKGDKTDKNNPKSTIDSPFNGILRFKNKEFYKEATNQSKEYKKIETFLENLKNSSIEELKNRVLLTPQLNKTSNRSDLKNNTPMKKNTETDTTEIIELTEAINSLNSDNLSLEEIKKVFIKLYEKKIDTALDLVKYACGQSSTIIEEFVVWTIDYIYENKNSLPKKSYRTAIFPIVKACEAFSEKTRQAITDKVLKNMIEVSKKNQRSLTKFLLECIMEKDSDICKEIVNKALGSDEEIVQKSFYRIFEKLLKKDKNLPVSLAFVLASMCAGKTSVACKSINESAFKDFLSTKNPNLINFGLQLAGIYCQYNDDISQAVVKDAYLLCQGQLEGHKDVNVLKNNLISVQKFFSDTIKKPHDHWKTVVNQAIETFNDGTQPLHFTFALHYLLFLRNHKNEGENILNAYNKGIQILKEMKKKSNKSLNLAISFVIKDEKFRSILDELSKSDIKTIDGNSLDTRTIRTITGGSDVNIISQEDLKDYNNIQSNQIKKEKIEEEKIEEEKIEEEKIEEEKIEKEKKEKEKKCMIF